MQLGLRIIGMIVGFIAAAIMLVVDILYSVLHVLARITGVSADSSHFFWGLFVTIIGFVGALLAPFSRTASLVLMLVSTVAFFFVVGFWAIIPAVFFAGAIVLVYLDRGATSSTQAPSGV